jgi:arylsulfatase
MENFKRREAFRQNLDLERVRGGLNNMINEALEHRVAN